jgi:hypothetical protein
MDEQTAAAREATAAYRGALEALPRPSEDDFLARTIQALIARDEVAYLLSKELLASPALIEEVAKVDRELKEKAKLIDQVIGRSTLLEWRETRQPPNGAWWWALDERVAPKPGLFWTILSMFLVAATIGLTTEIVRRFLSGGADLSHLSIPLAQAALTLLSGSVLTQAGQERLESYLTRRHVGSWQRFGSKFSTSLIFKKSAVKPCWDSK